jgi:nucleotide-binding universal stress UspA family protein
MTTGRQRIVVGVDGSEAAGSALEWAIEDAQRRRAEVEAVFAFDSGLAWIDVGSDTQATIVEHATTQARALLDEALAEALGDSCPVTVHSTVVQGSPAAALIEVARTADLLVVGSRGRGGFAGLLLGSVSQRCAEHAPCPVVVVPSTAGT